MRFLHLSHSSSLSRAQPLTRLDDIANSALFGTAPRVQASPRQQLAAAEAAQTSHRQAQMTQVRAHVCVSILFGQSWFSHNPALYFQ